MIAGLEYSKASLKTAITKTDKKIFLDTSLRFKDERNSLFYEHISEFSVEDYIKEFSNKYDCEINETDKLQVHYIEEIIINSLLS